MKKTILLLMLLALCLQTSAQHVTKDAAQEKAVKFLNQRAYPQPLPEGKGDFYPRKTVDAVFVSTTASLADKASRQQKAHSQKEQANAPYYIFNASDGLGYVIVSGDERAKEILGYSDTGHLSEETMPCGMKMLLDLYAEEINSLPELTPGLTPGPSPKGEGSFQDEGNQAMENELTAAPKKIRDARININAMLSCQWGQSSPYNGQCPTSGSSRCVVGCAATAMSQVLYYWGHQKGYDIKASTIPAYTTRSQGIKCGELPATSFDWANMKDKASSDAAAAKLCRYVGQALEMDYGANSSEAWGSDMAPAYREYFGIDNHVRAIFRTDYDYNEWEKFIYNEMEAGRPVILCGVYYSSGWGGHGFVCDGYQESTDKYHINWGWNGSYDGYFSLTALNSSGSTGTGSGSYTLYLTAIIGIQPPIEGHKYNQEDPRAAVVDLGITGSRSFIRENSEEDFKGITLFNAVYNHMQYNTELVAGLGVYDKDGNLLDVIAEAPLGRFDRYDGFGLEFTFGNLALGRGLANGTYFIRSISRSPKENTWRLSTNAEHNYITATITETELAIQPSVDLNITNVSGSGSWSSTYGATVTNNGSEESRGLLYAFSSSRLVNVIQTDIAAGETKTVTLGSTSIVKITSDFDGHRVLWTNSSSVPNIALTACAVNADKDGFFEGQKLLLDVSVTNNGTSAYTSQVSAKLCKEGSSTAVSTKFFTPNVAGKGIQTERLEFDGLTYNQPYTITLISGSYTVEQGNMTTSQPRTFYVYTVTPVEKTNLLGDVNSDGGITIDDVTATVSIILGKADEEWKKDNADMDGDGEITIADVTALVNTILEKSR